jgi:hypothetical protein
LYRIPQTGSRCWWTSRRSTVQNGTRLYAQIPPLSPTLSSELPHACMDEQSASQRSQEKEISPSSEFYPSTLFGCLHEFLSLWLELRSVWWRWSTSLEYGTTRHKQYTSCNTYSFLGYPTPIWYDHLPGQRFHHPLP